jgi:hypothetical protein
VNLGLCHTVFGIRHTYFSSWPDPAISKFETNAACIWLGVRWQFPFRGISHCTLAVVIF